MRLRPHGIFIRLFVLFLSPLCWADTFTSRTTGQVLHGYITGRNESGNVVAYIERKGCTPLKLTEWDVTTDRLGRENVVVVIAFEQELSLQIVAESLEQAISRAADRGPLLFILEINSPGGRADYVERICNRLIQTDYCPVIAFVKTGRYSGAISGSAAVALACDKIYMAPDTIIGAAAIADPFYGYGGEKLSVAWQEYLGTLARRKGRPELLARAMVDRNIEVVEVLDNGTSRFLQPSAVEPNQAIVRFWSRGGRLLTLTAADAAQSGIAEAIVADRAEVLRKLDVADAELVVDDSVAEAVATFKKARLKFNRLRNSLDGQIKRIEQTDNLEEAINLLREIRDEYKSLLSLAKRYPDLYLDVELIAEQLDSAADYYQQAKIKKRALVDDANEKAGADR